MHHLLCFLPCKLSDSFSSTYQQQHKINISHVLFNDISYDCCMPFIHYSSLFWGEVEHFGACTPPDETLVPFYCTPCIRGSSYA